LALFLNILIITLLATSAIVCLNKYLNIFTTPEYFESKKGFISYKVFIGSIALIINFLYYPMLSRLILKDYDNKLFKLKDLFAIDNLKKASSIAFLYLPIILLSPLYIESISSMLKLLGKGLPEFAQVLLSVSSKTIYPKALFYHSPLWTINLIIRFVISIIIILLLSRFLFTDYIFWDNKANVAQSFKLSAKLTKYQTLKIVILFILIRTLLVLMFIAFLILFLIAGYFLNYSLIQLIQKNYNFNIIFGYAITYFLIDNFIMPIVFLIKTSVYKQLSNYEQINK